MLRCSVWDLNPVTLVGKLWDFFLLVMGRSAGLGLMVRSSPSLSCLLGCGFLPIRLMYSQNSASLWVYLGRNCPISSYLLSVSVGGGECRIFLHHYLELEPHSINS